MMKKYFPDITLNDVVMRLGDSERKVTALFGGSNAGWQSMIAWNPAAEYYFTMSEKDDMAIESFVEAETAKGRYIIGYLSYDFGASLQGVELKSDNDLEMPDVVVRSFENYITFDQFGATAIGRHETFEDEITKLLNRSEKNETGAIYSESLEPVITREEYGKRYKKLQQHITRGDIYQANLTHRLEGQTRTNGRHIFSRSLQSSQANFGAYIEDEEFEIVSCSPERFVRIDGRVIETFPIKGTRPRAKDFDEDERLKDELIHSEKDAAELNMITDLMRNDLGKICSVGSVRVEEKRVITKLPTLWHTHSHITGQLASSMTVIGALLSLMPGGSITGCPKKRAIEIIDDLEKTRRGIYTGTIFCMTPDGTMDSNIAIRTLIKKANKLYLSVGGGIVYDSNEADEYQESLDKAAFWRGLDNDIVLSSDVLESQFGPTRIEILYQNETERIICTKTNADNKILEVSCVKFNHEGVYKFPAIHREIIKGRSMGKAFRDESVLFKRNEKYSCRKELPALFESWFGSTSSATIVAVDILVGAEKTHYATIMELYHPDVQWPNASDGIPNNLDKDLDEFAQKLANL